MNPQHRIFRFSHRFVLVIIVLLLPSMSCLVSSAKAVRSSARFFQWAYPRQTTSSLAFLTTANSRRRSCNFKSGRRFFSSENNNNNKEATTKTIQLEIPTAEDTEEVGALFSAIVLQQQSSTSSSPIATTILLDGDLGAGKTAFARGFLRAATGDDDLLVTSPTYLLVNVYPILNGSLE